MELKTKGRLKVVPMSNEQFTQKPMRKSGACLFHIFALFLLAE